MPRHIERPYALLLGSATPYALFFVVDSLIQARLANGASFAYGFSDEDAQIPILLAFCFRSEEYLGRDILDLA